jgi:hypothetical protein
LEPTFRQHDSYNETLFYIYPIGEADSSSSSGCDFRRLACPA